MTRNDHQRPYRAPSTTALALLMAALMALSMAPGAISQSGAASATFEDQRSGGATVTVAQATLPDGGFLAIHDASLSDGAVLKSVVGHSSFLEAGSHEDVTVHLAKPLTEDATLIAMPHKDTDGDRIYSFVSGNGEVDGPYTADGDIVVDDAEITVSATTTLTDQPTDGQSVLVDSVSMAEGGFIAIHDERLLEGMPLASVIGHSSFLEAGVHEDVRVELDRSLMGNTTLISMPHKDTNGNQNYDFVTSGGQEDGFYATSEGDPVIDDANVEVSSTATVTFEDQTTGGDHIYTATTFLPEGGFIAIHDEELAEGKAIESVRGHSEFLKPGLHRNVHAGLNEPLTQSHTLTAMPHLDTDGDKEYDFVTSDGSDDGPYTSDGEIVVDSGEAHYSADVQVEDQTSDGRTFTIPSADLSSGGFVTLHDPSLLAGEVTGSVVAVSSFLEPGHHDDIEVSVIDGTVSTTQTLIAMPHLDTDGDKTYDFVTSEGSDDGPYTTSAGNPVVVPFRATILATATFLDQDSSGTVSVSSATLHDGGFVTIHDASLLEGKVLDSVIGVSEKLTPGTHEGIQIQLDTDASGEVTLIAMPHLDTNENGAYDFVTSEGSADGPYVAAGGAVVDTAKVTLPQDTGDDGEASSGDDLSGPDDTDAGADGSGSDAGDQAPTPGLSLPLALLAMAGAAIALLRRR